MKHLSLSITRISAFFSLLLLIISTNAFATSVRPSGLGNMHLHAELIIHARSISNKSKQDAVSGRIVTYSTFEILDNIKGKAPSTYTIKQIGGELESGLSYKVIGVPKFVIGKEYILFLPPKSRLGFSSPVALSQGKFNILKNALNKEVSNGRNFTKMLEQVPDKQLTNKAMRMKYLSASELQETKPNRMELQQFKALLRKMNAPLPAAQTKSRGNKK